MFKSTCIVILAGLFLALGGGIGDAVAAAPSVDSRPPGSVSSVGLVVDDAPALRRAETAAPAPEIAKKPAAGGIVDLQTVPRTSGGDPVGPHRSHLQGEFFQYQGKDLAREPLIPVWEEGSEASLPEAQAKAARVFGASVAAWDAQGYSNWIPPDHVMAVGQEYIVEAVNSGFSVWSKAGTQTTAYTDFENFVNLPSVWNGFCYDPRVVYDPYGSRFVMTILGKDTTNLKSYIWLMVSTSDNPNGTWNRWRFDVSRGGTGVEEWLDFSTLGVDNWGIYFTGNYFFFAGGYSSSALWSYGRDYISGGSTGGYVWSDTRWPNNNYAFSIQPAHPLTTNAGGGTFFVNTYSSSGTEICLWTLTGKRHPGDSNPDAASLSNVAVNARTYYGLGENVNQPDNARDIDGGDARVVNAVYRAGLVYTTFGFDPDGDGSNGEVYVTGLTTAGVKDWDYTIWSDDYYYTYPSLAVNSSGTPPNWFVGMTITSDVGSIYPSTAGFVRDVGAAAISFYYDHAGTGDYVRLDDNNRNRWGDYSLSQFDSTCGNVFSVGEYATSSNTWATRIFARTLADEAPCVYLHQDYPIGGETFTAGQSVALNWDRLNLPAGDALWFKLDDLSGTFEWYGPFSTASTANNWDVPNFNGSFRMFVGSWDNGASQYSAEDWSDGAFTINGLPDLDVTSFSGPSSAETGQSINVGNTVTNIGPVTATGTALTSIRLSTDTSCDFSDTELAWRNIINLGAGSSSGATTPVTIPVSTSPGAYYICIWTDAFLNNINEFDELNNAGYFAVTISSAPADLIFSDGFETGNTTAWSSVAP